MKQARSFLILAVLSVLGYGLWVFDRSPAKPLTAPAQTRVKADSHVIPEPKKTAPALKAETPSWRPAIAEEFERARGLENDPGAAERRLDRLSQNLTLEETDRLAELVTTLHEDGDRRAVAVELLARADSTEAASALASIALSSVPATGEPRLGDFERALRGRAVEGLGHHSSPRADELLKQVANGTPDSFVSDRAHRALAYRQGRVPSPEDQDQEALRRLTQ